MNFVVSSSSLLKHLQAVSGVINTNAVLPILENFLFEVKGSKLTVSTTDLNTSMTTSLSVESKVDGLVAIPSKILLETLKTTPEQPIRIQVNPDNYAIELSTDKGKYKLTGENGDDFPKIPEVSQPITFSVPADRLLKAISSSLFAVGTDELRLAMTGLFVELHETGMNVVGTDAHKLVLHKIKNLAIPEAGSFIVPKKAINLLKSALPSNLSLIHI
jgi:DNA polymerase-3 subunit beta